MLTASTAELHPLDRISFGKIVQIREQLIAAQAAGTRVYRFESGDPSFDIAPAVAEALATAVRQGKTHYIPNDGIPPLRAALAAKLRAKNHLDWITADDVFVTNGAMHALYVTFQTLLSPGDEVIIPDPMWTEVAENIRLAGGTPVGVPLRAEEGYQYRPEAIERAITSRTVAIFVNTPHNPTGAVLPVETLRAIAGLAARRGLWIVSDEAYEDVLYDGLTHHSIGAVAGPDAKIVSVYSFSKSYAMAGLRVGYIATRDRTLHDRVRKLLRCTINGVNSVAQWGALAAVSGDASHLESMRAEYAVRRGLLVDALRAIDGFDVFVPGGAFYVWVEASRAAYARLGVSDAAGLSTALAQRGIGSAPGDAFGDRNVDAVRFAFSCDTGMVRDGCAALAQLFA